MISLPGRAFYVFVVCIECMNEDCEIWSADRAGGDVSDIGPLIVVLVALFL